MEKPETHATPTLAKQEAVDAAETMLLLMVRPEEERGQQNNNGITDSRLRREMFDAFFM